MNVFCFAMISKRRNIMQDKFYKIIANILELSDEVEDRLCRIESELGIKPESIMKQEGKQSRIKDVVN